MQVLKTLVVLVAVLEVFPSFGWFILTAVATHLFIGGILGHRVKQVKTFY